MRANDRTQFMGLLTTAMGTYAKPLPEPELIKVWWTLLEPFPLAVVQAAFTQYRRRDSKFAPVPAGIEQICINSDGRPDDEEAWTTSLLALDETETVVWTGEMEAAFWIAHTALDAGDQVGARMAFKQAYNRLVAEARAVLKPVKWQVTPGKNQERHRIVYMRNVELGRLPVPPQGSGLLLEGPTKKEKTDEQILKEKEESQKGLAMVRAELAKLIPTSEKLRIKREEALQEEMQRVIARKQELDRQKKAGLKKHAVNRNSTKEKT